LTTSAPSRILLAGRIWPKERLDYLSLSLVADVMIVVCWMIVMTTASNPMDDVDGLSSGMGAIAGE
jgi:UDP-N-acetylmuramyl pentapeptide phosphotransferase/UDP-N-acetylglucosamine-1-phosphate transferase